MQTTSLSSFRGMRLAPQQRLPIRRAPVQRMVIRASMGGAGAGDDPYQVRTKTKESSSLPPPSAHLPFADL